MPLVQTLVVAADTFVGDGPGGGDSRNGPRPATGEIVRCGPVGAVWEVGAVTTKGDRLEISLLPKDPHDVPLSGGVRELPRPLTLM